MFLPACEIRSSSRRWHLLHRLSMRSNVRRGIRCNSNLCWNILPIWSYNLHIPGEVGVEAEGRNDISRKKYVQVTFSGFSDIVVSYVGHTVFVHEDSLLYPLFCMRPFSSVAKFSPFAVNNVYPKENVCDISDSKLGLPYTSCMGVELSLNGFSCQIPGLLSL